MLLAHWTYTKKEWKAFLRSPGTKSGLFYKILPFFLSRLFRRAPEINITSEKVSIGNEHRYFSGERNQLRQVELRDEGEVNILSITYERKGNNREIKIPVPKGKLREAIEVQERLSQYS